MASMSDFSFLVDFAPAAGPGTASPTYSSITNYIALGDAPITLSRGRSNEQSGPQPGRGSMSLMNTDGRFTMGNGSSPYAPLKLRRPVRARVTYNGVTYPLWQGHVDDWGNASTSSVGRARLTMSDRLARAAGRKMRSAVEEEILSDGPIAYWPLTDPEGTTSADDITGTGVAPMVVTGRGISPVFGVECPVGPDGTTAVDFPRPTVFDTPDGRSLYAATSAPTITNGLTMECFVYIAAKPVGLDPSEFLQWGSTTQARLSVTTTGLIQFSDAAIDLDSPNPEVGDWHHVALVTQPVGGGQDTAYLYVDGVVVNSALYSTVNPGAGVWVAPGGAFTGSVAHVAVYTKTLSSARIADHAAAMRSWAGETTQARFERLCRVGGLTSGWYATDGGPRVQMGPQPLLGRSLFDALSGVADVEGGVLYVDAAGVMRLAAHTERYNTTSALTLDATKPGHVHADAEVRTDTLLLVNDATATRPGGSPQRVRNATSIADYDTADDSISLDANDDSICLNWSQWRVAANATPQQRIESIDIDVVAFATSGGSVAALLGIDINDRIKATNMPTTSSGTATLDLFVEGIKHRIEKSRWVITLITSPVGVYDGTWKLGQDLLGSGTRLGY